MAYHMAKLLEKLKGQYRHNIVVWFPMQISKDVNVFISQMYYQYRAGEMAPLVKSMCCCCRGPRFSSPNPHGD